MGHKLSFILKCTSHIIVFFLHIKTYALGEDIQYSWLEYNDKFDFMAGISVDGKPVCSGVIVILEDHHYILAPANPIERINDLNRVKIHVIDGDPNRHKVYNIDYITRDQGKRTTGRWSTFGFDNRHAPYFDLVYITIHGLILKLNAGIPRYPITPYEEIDLEFKSGGTFAFAGFGFIDKPHVKQNVELELVEYKYDEVWENCWEWIPAVWGTFICLSNIENFVGISSGAVLLYNDVLAGIGSFSVTRGSEGILVFTDYEKHTYDMTFTEILHSD